MIPRKFLSHHNKWPLETWKVIMCTRIRERPSLGGILLCTCAIISLPLEPRGSGMLFTFVMTWMHFPHSCSHGRRIYTSASGLLGDPARPNMCYEYSNKQNPDKNILTLVGTIASSHVQYICITRVAHTLEWGDKSAVLHNFTFSIATNAWY